VDPDAINQLRSVLQQANAFEAEAIGGLNTQLSVITAGAIAAPAIPVVIAVAPFAGSLVGVEARTATNSPATMARFPIVVGIGMSAVSTAIDASFNGDWQHVDSAFVNHLATQGMSGMIMAPFLALIPVQAAAMGGAAWWYFGSEAAGVTVYGWSNMSA